MKAIRLKLHQDYTRFNASKIMGNQQTYPLPPFSTVIGMIHTACNWNTYHPIDLFISGFGYQNSEMKRRWVGGGASFGAITPEMEKRWSVIVDDPAKPGMHKGWTQTMKFFDFLADFDMICYILPDDPADLSVIYSRLLAPSLYPALGEWENICRIDEVSIVDLQEYEEERSGNLFMQSWIPAEKAVRYFGTAYNLNRNYVIENGRRVFKKIRCKLLCSGQAVSSRYYDGEHPVVFLDR